MSIRTKPEAEQSVSHAPGPWRSQGWVPTWTYIPVHDSRHNVVCSVYPNIHRGGSYDEAAATASLIAASPDLFAALKAMITWGVEPDPDSKSERERRLASAWIEARATIARAEGRQP